MPDRLAAVGRDLAGAVLELPRRIGEDRPEPPPPRGADQIEMRGEGWGAEENIWGSCTSSRSASTAYSILGWLGSIMR